MVDLADTRNWLKHLPNKLTLGRMAAIPLLLVIYWCAIRFDSAFLHVVSALIFAVAALTDLLDGYLARRYGNVTPLGALLDQVADKMLVATALVLLASSGAIPAFMAALLIARDFAVNGIRLMALEQNIRISVNDLGKWKTTLLAVAMFCLFINYRLWELPFREVGMVCLWLGFALSAWSAWQYGRGFLQSAKL